MKHNKGLICEIFRWHLGECSNGGLSSRVQAVTLIDADGPFAPTDDRPAVRLVRRQLEGGEYVHAEPITDRPKPWFMAGGTFIFSHDSRWRDAVGHSYPISLHDRVES